ETLRPSADVPNRRRGDGSCDRWRGGVGRGGRGCVRLCGELSGRRRNVRWLAAVEATRRPARAQCGEVAEVKVRKTSSRVAVGGLADMVVTSLTGVEMTVGTRRSNRHGGRRGLSEAKSPR